MSVGHAADPVLVVVACAALTVLLWPWRPRQRWHPGARSASTGEHHGGVGVPEVLDLLALALEGGAGLVPAMDAVAERLPGARGAELAQVVADLASGVAEHEAWDAVPALWAPARRALSLAATAGVPPAALLRAAAADARGAAIATLERRTAELSVRLVLPLGLAFLPAFVLVCIVPVVLALAGGLLTS